MSETHGLITDDDLDSLDTLDVDTMTVAVSDLYVLAPRLRARWVADALDELAAEPGPVQRVARVLLQERAAEYRDGTR